MLSPASRLSSLLVLSTLLSATAFLGCGGAKGNELFAPSGLAGRGGNGGNLAGAGAENPSAGRGAAAGMEATNGGGANQGGSAGEAGDAETAGAPGGGEASAGSVGDAGHAGSAGAGSAGSAGFAGMPGSGASAGNPGGTAGGTGGNAGFGAAGSPACMRSGNEICDGVDNDCDGMTDENACPAQCTGFVALGKSYMVCRANGSQSRAIAACEDQGMRLVWIVSAEQNAALIEALGPLLQGSQQTSLYIGATDVPQETRWHWINGANFWHGDSVGTPVNDAYVNWAVDRPNARMNENCAVVLLNMPSEGLPGQWNDAPCNEPHGPLCEAP